MATTPEQQQQQQPHVSRVLPTVCIGGEVDVPLEICICRGVAYEIAYGRDDIHALNYFNAVRGVMHPSQSVDAVSTL